MTTCPFCDHDPYHYVDIGVGMERVAVTCCELGIELFDHRNTGDVTLSREEFLELADAIRALRDRKDGIISEADRDDIIQECLDEQPITAENPNEDSYQRGKFDGVMEFAQAIQALKADHGDPRTPQYGVAASPS